LDEIIQLRIPKAFPPSRLRPVLTGQFEILGQPDAFRRKLSQRSCILPHNGTARHEENADKGEDQYEGGRGGLHDD
jgi:hypothetical protein